MAAGPLLGFTGLEPEVQDWEHKDFGPCPGWAENFGVKALLLKGPREALFGFGPMGQTLRL